MSLLSEIQDECTSKDADVSRLLRLCLQLAVRLRHEPLKQWVLHELNGYPAGVELPEYRVLQTRSRGFFADRFIGQATLDIPMKGLGEPLRTRFSQARLDQPIQQYIELTTGDGELQLPWPQELAQAYGPKVSPIQCLRMWQELPKAAVVGFIDTVKTRVLSMALEIEAENPAAGEIAGSSMQISEAKVSQIFNTNIYGGQVGNVAAGGSGVVQKASIKVVQGDLASLRSNLASIGVALEDVSALEIALEGDKAAGSPGLGERVSQWLSRLGKRAQEAGADAGTQVVAGLAVQAILAYLGIGG